MNPADAQPAAAVQSIPLDKLEISLGNVRKTDAGLQSFAELKANIAALGILSNLVVRPVPGDPDRFAIVAGARRYGALTQLAAEGQVPTDMPVPCRIVDADASETEISLAENLIRAAMHPADQVQAFAALADAGSAVSAIAARFGVAERTVEQRLRLGNAAPELLQAYREDAMDLECLKAFAITTDRVRQMTVWSRVSEQGYRPTAWQIKRMLTESRVPAGAAVAAFVGVEVYEAAGGTVDRDLFADEHEFGVWFEDPQLLDKLALERLQAAADDLAREWKWAEPRLEIEWSDTARFGRVQPVPGEATPEEIAESERLQARQEELSNMDPDELTEELYAESQRNEERLEEIEAEVQSRASFTDEDKAIAGCIVTIDHDGDLHVVGGLVRPEDVPSADADEDAGAGTGEDGNTGAASGPRTSPPVEPPRMSQRRNGDPAARARKAAGIGIGLADDLRAIRTAGIKARLATDFDAAFDLFLFQEAQSVFDQGYRPTCLEITARETANRPHLRINDESFAEASPFEADLADWSGIPLDWMEHEDRGKAFEALRALPVERKQALFAAIVARTVKGQLSFEHDAHPELEATVARLDIDFASRIRVSAEMFWSRITKSNLLEIGRSVLGADWAAAHSKEKKAVLAASMERAFGAGDDLPPSVTPEGRAAALAWVPPGFAAFDRAGVEDDSDAPEDRAEPQPSPAQSTADDADTASDPDTAAQEPNDTAAPPGVDPETAAPEEGGTPPRFIVDGDALGNADVEQVPVPHAPDPSVPVNGHAAASEAMEIPEFLRRT